MKRKITVRDIPRLKVNSIFSSIDGEVNPWYQGTLSTFVRLQGCNLRCTYCFGIRPGRRIPRVITSVGPTKKLCDVKVGDKLLTFNENSELVETSVVKTMERTVDKWVELTINGKIYFVTPEHPFFTARGLVEAQNLTLKDEILHSSSSQKMSFRIRGNRNPIKDPQILFKKVSNTDWKSVGEKVSRTRKRMFANGHIRPKVSFEARRKISESKIGSKNPMWKGGRDNYNHLRRLISKGNAVCEHCRKILARDVHHKDSNNTNDDRLNLLMVCHSCHSQLHKIGYNFWVPERRDEKKLQANNGFPISKIRFIDRFNKRPSLRVAPLKVFNLSCSPHNTYLVDYMWVHNCDTEYAQDDHPNYLLTASEVADKIGEFRCMKVTLTGGEPLLQKDLVKALLDILVMRGYRISIETNGTIEPIKGYHPDVCYVVDYKLPSAGLSATQDMRDSMFLELTSFDFVKFVIGNKLDYEVAMSKYLYFLQKGCEAEFAIGIHGKEVKYKELINWIKRDGFTNLIVNVQLHKLIGVE